MLYILIILFLIGFIVSQKETFDVVGLNSELAKHYDQNIMYNQETEKIDNILNKLSTMVLPDYKSQYTKYPYIIHFIYDKQIRDIIVNVLLPKFQEVFTDIKIHLPRELYNIYFHDNDKTTRTYIFNVDLVSKNHGFARKLKILLDLKNLQNYILDDGSYNNFVTLDKSDINIKYIGLDNDLNYFTTYPSDPLLLKEYEIKNKYFLMDPFLTSRKEMEITNEDQTNFNKVVMGKYNQTMHPKSGVCYKSNNPNISSKEECVDIGGVWDYPVTKDQECPFYMSNQNYPNTFGAANNNICSMPINMQVIGNRFYDLDPKYKPLCYNCKSNLIGKDTLGMCCDDQKNKEMYPNLITPDYAFIGDTINRTKYKQQLNSNNLSVN